MNWLEGVSFTRFEQARLRTHSPEMDCPLEPDLLLHLETVDGLDVLDPYRLHVLGPSSVDVPVGLLDGGERVMLPEVRVHWDLQDED